MTTPKHAAATSQEAYPLHSMARTVFQALVGLAAAWGLIVEAAHIDSAIPWVATSLAITAAITRVMTLPAVNQWLARFVPWLAPEGKVGGDANV